MAWLPLGAMACDGPPPLTGRVIQEDVASDAVGDVFRLLIRLPPGYDDSEAERYPVAYQLDATSFGPQFDITAGHASELEQRGRIPETIVVGIGYPYEDPLVSTTRGRGRDYVTNNEDGSPGGAARFSSFIRDELIPRVDEAYRTDPSRRVLLGHSLGGFFALYTMLTTGAESSPPFDGFVAGDPSLGLDDLRLFVLEEQLSEQTSSLPFRLYLPIGRYDGAVQHLFFDEIVSRLETHYPDLELGARVLDTDHGGTISPGFRQGLEFVLTAGEP